MPRYIDADALKETLKNLEARGNNMRYVQGLQDAIDGFFSQIIVDEPTADVEPVRHGRWGDSFDGITPVCTVCGRTHSCFNRTPEFCPHCGAKMDGGAENEQDSGQS